MNRRRTVSAATALALSFGVLVAGSASAAPYGGHAMRKYGPSKAQVAQGIQQAQWAEEVRALDAGTVTLPSVAPSQSARDKQGAQFAAQVRGLDEGTVSLPSGNLRPPVAVAEPLPAPGPSSNPGTTFGYWLTIGLLSGLLALAMSMVLRRRPRPQLSL